MVTVNLTEFADSYASGTPGDVINGRGGNDTLTASEGGNQLYGGDGDDVLKGGAGNDVLQGDDLTSFSSINILNGYGGDDRINSNSWGDQVKGGAGNDLVNSFAQRTGQVIDGGIGIDRLNVLSLVSVNDPVNVSFGAVFVFTVKGINGATYTNFESLEVTLGTGPNTITGSSGNDRLFTAYLNGSNATVAFDAGLIRAEGGDDSVAFNGITRPGSGIQVMDGGTGTDSLAWTSGNAVINDLTINADKGNMLANGAKFASFTAFETVSIRTFDPITGTFAYTGFFGADLVLVGAQQSAINTLRGNDQVEVASGTATVNGGSGDDLLRASFPNASGVTLNGDQGADTLIGGMGVAWLNGGEGDDDLQANNSFSQVFGGGGDDVLSLSFVQSQLGSGTALIDGGAGQDVVTVTLFPTTTGLVLDLSGPTLTLANGAVFTGIEGFRLRSTSGADDITASGDARGALFNTVDGGFGDDTLRAVAAGVTFNGSFGADSLLGGAGDDVLIGGFGAENDTLRGFGGDDVLIGSIGRDLLQGGRGADLFTLAQSFESGVTGQTRDLIVDFSRAQGDRLDLAAVDAMALAGSLPNDDFTFIGTAAFGSVAGQLRFEQVDLAGRADDITLVSGDLQGDGLADFTIEIRGLIALTAGDIVL